MSMHAMPECEQSQKNGCCGVSRPWWRMRMATALRRIVLLLFGAGMILSSQPVQADHIPYALGDVFAAVGGGKILHYSPSGTLREVLDTTGSSAHNHGMCFDAAGNLYSANWDVSNMTRFNNKGGLETALWAGPFNSYPESCVVDAAGNIYVGQSLGTKDILKFNAAGSLLAPSPYDVTIQNIGSDWIALAADQKTMFYTSEGNLVKRWDVSTNTSLPDFATILPASPPQCFELRIRQSGEVLVACTSAVYRLSTEGIVTQTYSIPSETFLFSLSLDPDGVTFWTGGHDTRKIYRINIATGATVTSFTTDPNPPYFLTGLAVFALDTDGDLISDNMDNCPTAYNPPTSAYTPPTTWKDYLGASHDTQPDFDLDGVGDACDNCKKVANANQADTDGNLLGDACEGFKEALTPLVITSAPGAPKWFTAQFLNNTGAAINTIQPDCINTLFTVNPQGSPNAILPPRYHHRAYGVPDDVVNIAAGAYFSVTCDVNEMFDPSVLSAGTYDVKATYSNDIDPNNNLFVGAVQSTTTGKLEVTGAAVTQTKATVLYDPSAWSTQWVTTGSPSPIKADINLVTGSACNGIDIGQPIMMNGFASGQYTAGVTGAPAHAIASFSGSQAVQSLGTTIPGTYSPTVQGSCQNGALFTAKARITLGLTVLIDIMPGTSPNKINASSTGVVPVAILGSPTFDATKVIPGSVTLAGGSVNIKSVKGKATPQFSITDVNLDGRLDMVLQINTTTMTLNNSMTFAVLEGLYVKDLGNGDTQNVPIYGSDTVVVVK